MFMPIFEIYRPKRLLFWLIDCKSPQFKRWKLYRRLCASYAFSIPLTLYLWRFDRQTWFHIYDSSKRWQPLRFTVAVVGGWLWWWWRRFDIQNTSINFIIIIILFLSPVPPNCHLYHHHHQHKKGTH